MNRILVWDLPTRLFHWLLAAGFIAAFGIATLSSDDAPLFPYHMLVGLALGLLVILRVVWGFTGTRYARFRSFLFSPAAVFAYFKDAVAGRGQRHIGHNPGSSYAMLGILALVPASVVTGLLMSRGGVVEELHEIFAWTTVVLVVLHLLGVIAHTIRQRENITASMIHGTKVGEPAEAIPSARPLVAVGLVVVLAAWTVGLYRNYNAAARETRLPVLGLTVQLGEREHESGGDGARPEGHDDD